MTTYFAPIARLLGDLVVSLPPLQRLISDEKDVSLIIRSPAQEGLAERILGLSNIIRESEFLRIPGELRAKLYNLRDHPLQTRFVWGSPEFNREYPGYGISDVIREICADFGIADGQQQLTPLQTVSRQDCVGKLILIPGTSGPIKRWASLSWLRLHRELKSRGINSVMIGEPRVNTQISGLMKSGMPWVPTRTLADALDAVSSSAGVVSVDTGLMHLAVHQGIKTIGIFREYTMFFRNYPHAKYVIAPECSAECRAREFDFSPNTSTFYDDWNLEKAFEFWSSMNCQLPPDASCMMKITVEQIIEQLANNAMI